MKLINQAPSAALWPTEGAVYLNGTDIRDIDYDREGIDLSGGEMENFWFRTQFPQALLHYPPLSSSFNYYIIRLRGDNMSTDIHAFLKEILEKLQTIDYVKPESLPNIDLYMDQVTTFMDSQLASTKR